MKEMNFLYNSPATCVCHTLNSFYTSWPDNAYSTCHCNESIVLILKLYVGAYIALSYSQQFVTVVTLPYVDSRLSICRNVNQTMTQYRSLKNFQTPSSQSVSQLSNRSRNLKPEATPINLKCHLNSSIIKSLRTQIVIKRFRFR